MSEEFYEEPPQEEEKDSAFQQQPFINPLESPNYNVVDKQLETLPTLQKLREWLLGIKDYDQTTGEPEIGNNLKMCNEEGANALLAEVNSSLDPHVVLGYLDVDEVRTISEEFEKDLAFKVVLNGEAWEIKQDHYEIICDTIGRIFFANLTRTINGATHKGVTSVSLVREQLIQRDGANKTDDDKGFFEKIGFKRR